MNNIALAARERYRHRGPSGFLRIQHRYEIQVNGETMYQTTLKRDAGIMLRKWKSVAGAKWTIQLFRDGEEIQLQDL